MLFNKKTLNEVLRSVKALLESDKRPENWPNNNPLEDNLIIPLAKDEATKAECIADAKAGKIECLDWWFCYKKRD